MMFQLTSLFNEVEGARQVLRQHLLPVQLGLDDLDNTTKFYTLEGGSAELVNKARSSILGVIL